MEQENSVDLKEKNLGDLKTSLEIRGVDPKVYADLEKGIKEGKPEFTIPYIEDVGDKQIACQLPFNKHKELDHYYFNRFQATLLSEGEVLAQATVKASWKITVQEIARLLEYGQNVAVYKQNIIGFKQNEGEDQPLQQHKFNAYITLDPEGRTDEQGNLLLNTYHDNYYAKRPFDIRWDLENPEIPFRTKHDYESVDALVRDIHKAIPVEIIMTRNGIEEDGFLNVNARRGKLNFMDSNGISIDPPQIKQEQRNTVAGTGEVKKKPLINQSQARPVWKPKQSKGFSR